MTPRLILGSSSPYRAELLARLQLPFTQDSPAIDEAPRDDETPEGLALRLARDKAQALRDRYPQALLVTGDQVAAVDGTVLGKPGDEATARSQLRRCAGRAVTFYTALRLSGARGNHEHVDRTVVRFRPLSTAEIQRYLEREGPLDCAGSFKAEGLGIALFEALETRDPTAIVGLPLIALARMLRAEGLAVP